MSSLCAGVPPINMGEARERTGKTCEGNKQLIRTRGDCSTALNHDNYGPRRESTRLWAPDGRGHSFQLKARPVAGFPSLPSTMHVGVFGMLV